MIAFSSQQKDAVDHKGNALVTACPGSGKTRVLTGRVIKGLSELASSTQRVVALTFTNRASDEIQSRLDKLGIENDQLWTGTIHSFALEWVLRPYAPYVSRLRKGFSVADEYYTEKILRELRKKYDKPPFLEVNTKRDRAGVISNNDPAAASIFNEYQEHLEEDRLVDYDDILHYAFQVLGNNEEIASTIGSIVQLFCMDEIQDTQDLQFGILSRIIKAAKQQPMLFLVGDADQCIYESLGAVSKTTDEIAHEFGLNSLSHLELTGNYRSSQRLINYYQHFRPESTPIVSLAEHADEPGLITFQNNTIAKEDLSITIAEFIRNALDSGIPENEICVLAPQWWHIRALGRSLVGLIPEVDFDAPGLSPFHSQRENLWFKIARLFLTTSRPGLYRTRMRWAGEVLLELVDTHCVSIPESLKTPRRLLRFINSILSEEEDGLEYLIAVFNVFLTGLDLDLNSGDALRKAYELFFEKANSRLDEIGDNALRDIQSFQKLFRHPSGVVISTCHGVKGEEYDTVIAFGLLAGYIPNWQVIIKNSQSFANDQASKLLYVISSRAKRHLHLIAESGRFTKTQNEYQTTPLLAAIDFDYDPPKTQ